MCEQGSVWDPLKYLQSFGLYLSPPTEVFAAENLQDQKSPTFNGDPQPSNSELLFMTKAKISSSTVLKALEINKNLKAKISKKLQLSKGLAFEERCEGVKGIEGEIKNESFRKENIKTLGGNKNKGAYVSPFRQRTLEEVWGWESGEENKLVL